MMKVFSVGNSFSGNAHTYFQEIAESAGKELVLGHAMIGGCSFERHMRHADAFDADPNDPEGKPYNDETQSLKELLTGDQWDVVTIQQASPLSFVPESYHPHADRLVQYIRKYAPRAEIVVHQTWAYRDDHSFWDRGDMDTDIMYQGLRRAYDDFCSEYGFRFIPSGDAFQTARLSSEWGRFIPADPETGSPAVRSLHADDSFHANNNGCYLLGCLWYEFLFKDNAGKVAFKPEDITPENAEILKGIAHKVATGQYRP